MEINVVRAKRTGKKAKAEQAAKVPDARAVRASEFRKSDHVGRLLLNGNRVFERIAAAGFRASGFHDIRATHLVFIRNLPLEGRRTSEIAELSSMTKQAVGQLAIELEDAGYVVRLPDPTDGRAKLVLYTKKGQQLVAEIPRILLDTEAQLEAMIGAAEFAVLRRTLLKLARVTGYTADGSALLTDD